MNARLVQKLNDHLLIYQDHDGIFFTTRDGTWLVGLKVVYFLAATIAGVFSFATGFSLMGVGFGLLELFEKDPWVACGVLLCLILVNRVVLRFIDKDWMQPSTWLYAIRLMGLCSCAFFISGLQFGVYELGDFAEFLAVFPVGMTIFAVSLTIFPILTWSILTLLGLELSRYSPIFDQRFETLVESLALMALFLGIPWLETIVAVPFTYLRTDNDIIQFGWVLILLYHALEQVVTRLLLYLIHQEQGEVGDHWV